MCALTHAVTVQVHSGAHFITMSVGMKGLAVERQGFTTDRVLFSPVIVTDLPKQGTIEASSLKNLKS